MNLLPASSDHSSPGQPAAGQLPPGCDYPVVVIGGGPSGAIAALRLAAALGDCSVLIVDREHFPRSKVCGCCLNGAAVGALGVVGLADLPAALKAIPLTRWQAQIAKQGGTQKGVRSLFRIPVRSNSQSNSHRVPTPFCVPPFCVEVPLPGGWAVSREAFDAALLEQARRAGAEVRTGVVARIVSASAAAVQIELKSGQGTETVRAAAVVVASGLSGGGLESILPWRQPPAGPIGLGATLQSAEERYAPGTIYMACDRTGYAGLVRLEDGRLDIAAAVYDPSGDGRRRGAGERVAAILEAAGMPAVAGIEAATWRGTPRLHRQRQPGRGRVIAVGDAAGYVEPFTGEGMAWGMQTGLLAAQVILEAAKAAKAAKAMESIGVRYTRQYDRMLSRRRLPCRMLTAALRPAWSRRMLFQMLSTAPWLAAPVVRRLNQPESRP